MRELLGSSPFSLSVVASCVRLQLRPFPPPELPGFVSTTSRSAIPVSPAGLSRVASGSAPQSPLGLPVLRLTPFACMPSPLPRQVRWKLVRSYIPIVFGLPRIVGGSAPATPFSRPAQRSLTLRPACSPSRLCDLLHRRLQQLRCLRRCFGCYRVERTSSRAGFLSR